MKRILLILMVLMLISSVDAETWELVEDTSEIWIYSLESFDGYIYAGSSNNGYLYRSSNGTHWEFVVSLSDPGHIHGLKSFGDHIYAGLGNNGYIYRSLNGVDWEFVEDVGTIVHCLEVFDGYIYAGTYPGGCIYRSSNGQDWELAENTPEDRITSLKSFKSHIYAGSEGSGKIYWSYNGIGWDMIEDTPEYRISSLESFGSHIYAGTTETRIYRSYNGIDWDLVMDLSPNGDVHSLKSFDGYIYAGTASGIVYKSSDGTDWQATNDTSIGSIHSLESFGGHLYAGTGNAGKIYRIAERFINLYFVDACANPLINPQITIFKNMEIIFQKNCSVIDYKQDNVNVQNGDVIEVFIDTHDYAEKYTIVVQEETALTMYHHTVDWDMNVHIQDNQTHVPIEDVYIVLEQECKPDPDKPLTTCSWTNENGTSRFYGLSNQEFKLWVTKDGYDPFYQTINVSFDAWMPLYGITIDLASTGNESEQNATSSTAVWFTDTDGHITSKIKDTDAYTDLHYWINRVDGQDMTLKFEKWSNAISDWIPYHIIYDIPNGSSDYIQLTNDNFSCAGSYRGRLFSYEEDSYDVVQSLKVYNESNDTETQLENLTAHVLFLNKFAGNQVDYKEDIEILVYANSTNSTLLDINVSFWKENVLIDYKLLNWADFVSGDPKWYYIWYPDSKYESGYNYTTKIYAYDDTTLLDVDHVFTSNIRNNRLTVTIKDTSGQLLSNVYVFVETIGSQHASGSSVSFEGLNDGLYRYKASKSGYQSGAWESVNLTGDESVIYVLCAETGTGSIQEVKMTDDEVKNIYYPLMYLLLIIILIGGLMNVFK